MGPPILLDEASGTCTAGLADGTSRKRVRFASPLRLTALQSGIQSTRAGLQTEELQRGPGSSPQKFRTAPGMLPVVDGAEVRYVPPWRRARVSRAFQPRREGGRPAKEGERWVGREGC